MTSKLTNSVNPLNWQVPIVNKDGTPTNEFMRKWQQQGVTNGKIPNLVTGQPLHFVLAASPTGPTAPPLFRLLVASDIPTLPYDPSGAAATAQTNAEAFAANASNLSSGTVGVARLPVATTATLGVVKPDGTTITISGGVISSVGSGSSGGAASIQDSGTAIKIALSDANGQLVLDGSGNPVFVPEVFPVAAIPTLPYDASGAAATAQTNAETFATAADVTVLSTAETYAKTAQTIRTRQILTGGTTYTLPTSPAPRQILVRMVGGGGGGGGSSQSSANGGNGGAGADTIFNAYHAHGGAAGSGVGTGSGYSGVGANGSGAASVFRMNGESSVTVVVGVATSNQTGSNGGDTPMGNGAYNLQNAAANTGGGGGGAGVVAAAGAQPGSGGGAAEFVELIINAPASSYTIAIGAGGTAGIAGTGGLAAGAGGSGLIIVDEFY